MGSFRFSVKKKDKPAPRENFPTKQRMPVRRKSVGSARPPKQR
jgi:hypothetical protein